MMESQSQGDHMRTFQRTSGWWVVVSGLALAGLLAVFPPAVSAQGKKSSAPAAKVDLNVATEKELEDLPGVGPATAKKIIAGRPYGSVAELSKAGVPAKTIQKITPLVAVGAASAAGAASAPAATAPAAPPPAKSSSPSAAKATESAKSGPTQAQVPPEKGMVWVNTKSGVFHYEGDRWYGKTKEGKFMTEADAVKAGYHASKEGAAKKGGGG
jgi:hypothetical protein